MKCQGPGGASHSFNKKGQNNIHNHYARIVRINLPLDIRSLCFLLFCEANIRTSISVASDIQLAINAF